MPAPSRTRRRRSEVRFTTRGASLLAAGLATCIGAVLLGESDLLAVGVALLVLVLACWLLLRLSRIRLSITQRATPTEARPGDPVAVQVGTTVTASVPLGELICHEETSEGLSATRDLALDPTAARRGVSLPFQTTPRRRGRHTVGPLRVTSRDPFGIATATTRDCVRLDVLGLPTVHPVDLSGLPDHGAQIGAFLGVDLGRSTELDVSLREHRSEDGLRRVHWPTSARLGRLMTRVDEPTADRDCVIILDDRDAAHRGPTFEAAVTTAASLTATLNDLGHRVWLWAADGAAPAPRAGWNTPAALRHLAPLEPVPATELALDPWALQRDVGGGPVFLVSTGYADLPGDALGRIAGWASVAVAVLLGSSATEHRRESSRTEPRADLLRERGWTVRRLPAGAGLAEALASGPLPAVRRR